MTAAASCASADAADQLTRSRAQLRQAMLDVSAPAGSAARPDDAARADDRAANPLFAAWLDRLTDSPAGRCVVTALRVWWDRHPLRLTTRLVADAAATLVQPVAQQHPLRLVLVSAAAGALLVFTRPWRWALRPALVPALLAGLLPQLLSQAAAQVPPGAWATLLGALTQGRPRAGGR